MDGLIMNKNHKCVEKVADFYYYEIKAYVSSKTEVNVYEEKCINVQKKEIILICMNKNVSICRKSILF